MNQVPGIGMGSGRGRGRGWRHCYYATGLPGWARAGWAPVLGVPFYGTSGTRPAADSSPEQELEVLKTQVEDLQGALGNINKRIKELESPAKEE